MNTLRNTLLTVLLAAGLAFAQNEGIRVSGNGTAFGSPDTALFTVGVNALDTDVSAATGQANDVAAAMITALTEAGIEPADIRTSSFNVHREDRRNDAGEILEPQYRVTNTLDVTVRDSDSVGELLSLALANGANQVHSLQFTISDPAELRSQARERAMEDAHERAAQLAALAGVRLGDAIYIEEFSSGGSPRAMQTYMTAEAASVPVSAGELSVQVDLVVVFAILPAD